jgi:CheY-like chemotaxis protein
MTSDLPTAPRILLVDDYEDARVMYGHFLRMSGYHPIEAATGEEALELAYRHLPDLILLDMSLPGIDGWEVTAELKSNEKTKHIPIVALTAHALQTERQRTERAGCDGFLAKPCAPPDLLAEISRLLGRRPGPAVRHVEHVEPD